MLWKVLIIHDWRNIKNCFVDKVAKANLMSGWHMGQSTLPQNKQGVCHTVTFAIYIENCLKGKEELWKLKCFTLQEYYLQKIL
jgi:hypothetical protein